MPTLADLSRSLAHVEISKPATAASVHILEFEYPVQVLLPDGAILHLPQPSQLAQRERPPTDQRNAGVYEISMFAMVPVQPKNPFAVKPAKDTGGDLVASVEAAACDPGITAIEIVSFSGPSDGPITYRIRLQSRGDFELGESEWAKLRTLESRLAWVRVLSNLVNRRSARSYYHVRQLLQTSFGAQSVIADQKSWSTTWDTQPPRSANDLLLARLGLIDAKNSYGPATSKLPCGHTSIVRKISIDALLDSASSRYTCMVCSERVLQAKDDVELMLRTQRRRARMFASSNVDTWLAMKSHINEHEPSIRVSAESLLCALSASLNSLRAPAFIALVEMAFAGFPETRAVFNAFEDTFGNQSWVKEVKPDVLYEVLIELAESARPSIDGPTVADSVLPEAWYQDFSRWLIRAVRLLTDCGCTKLHSRHEGVHRHGNVVRIGLQDPTDDTFDDADGMDEESDGVVVSMAELAGLMGDASLEEDLTGLDDLNALPVLSGVDDDASAVSDSGSNQGAGSSSQQARASSETENSESVERGNGDIVGELLDRGPLEYEDKEIERAGLPRYTDDGLDRDGDIIDYGDEEDEVL
ncbi:hypothetical protein LTR53_010808 [Teratosphaeriaceae sp. CCFEE 6253]|nr:hypothetical protein LTR53_010808 [Teratosphaeriaceae sp. CCFEE 6253]